MVTGGEWRVEWNVKEHKESFWSERNILYLECGSGFTGFASVKTNQIIYFTWMQLIECKFYFNENDSIK